ncbi:ParB/RepB/Spo0J family partition protein [Microbacterium sp. NPDC055665]
MTTTSTVELIEAHPALIQLETNIRTEAALDAGFLAAIRANGVLTPVLGHRNEDGTVTVRAGQRRVLAAREVGLETVPVYLVPSTDDFEADRIVQQLVENEQRDSMTDVDKVAAYKALELEGLSVAAIAKRTGTKRDTVKTSLAVAANETATAAINEHPVTLDQAAVLMEFDGEESIVATLIQVATTDPAQFEHAVQRARDDRARAEKRQELVDELTAKCLTIRENRPGYYDKTPVNVADYATADGEKITLDTLAGLDGVSAYVQVYYGGSVDVSLYIEDPKAHGFKKRTASGQARTPMTDDEKAERRVLIENNKQWEAAETVRREWLATFLGRRTLPKNTTAVVAELLASGRYLVGDAVSHGNALAADLLGVDGPTGFGIDRLPDYLTAHPTKAAHVNLAIVLAGVEAHTDRSTWRSPRAITARYLHILQGWGYGLSPVEKIAAMIQDDQTEDTDAPES